MREGLQKHGIYCDHRERFTGIRSDLAIAYGWVNEPIFRAYHRAGLPYVHVDLGYWDRRPHKRAREGHHRIAVNNWDTGPNMARGMPDDRFKASGIKLGEWNPRGDQILIAAMSAKSARVHGYRLMQWENDIRFGLGERTVKIRAKPVGKRHNVVPIENELKHTSAVFAHHSNVCVDALIAGVPFACVKGVGALLSPLVGTVDPENLPAFSEIERHRFLSDVAYAQWTPDEMRSGKCWEYIKCILASI